MCTRGWSIKEDLNLKFTESPIKWPRGLIHSMMVQFTLMHICQKVGWNHDSIFEFFFLKNTRECLFLRGRASLRIYCREGIAKTCLIRINHNQKVFNLRKSPLQLCTELLRPGRDWPWPDRPDRPCLPLCHNTQEVQGTYWCQCIHNFML